MPTMPDNPIEVVRISTGHSIRVAMVYGKSELGIRCTHDEEIQCTTKVFFYKTNCFFPYSMFYMYSHYNKQSDQNDGATFVVRDGSASVILVVIVLSV